MSLISWINFSHTAIRAHGRGVTGKEITIDVINKEAHYTATYAKAHLRMRREIQGLPCTAAAEVMKETQSEKALPLRR